MCNPFLGKYDYNLLKERLFTGILCDIMDQEMNYMDYRLPPVFRAVNPNNCMMLGTAYTLQFRDTCTQPPRGVISKGNVDMAVENVSEYSVVVMACQGSYRGSCLGEMMSTACRNNGASGIIVDGAVRDVAGIRKVNIPVTTRYIVPYSGWGKLDHCGTQVPVEFAGKVIKPGDLIAADEDGIIVIPIEMAEKVIDMALERVLKEDETMRLLSQGVDIRTVFNTTGVM